MKATITEERYPPQQIEAKWQKIWKEKELAKAQDFAQRPKFYCLVEFPYPSGAGLHVGHVRAWAAMDAYARRKRMQGFNVLYPLGWDAFGLPAENYALKMGIHPSRTVAENIARFKRQCQALGLSFAWEREINTTDPSYYRWTQWIFLKMLEKGLAYRAAAPVNWCPACKTNLADEEVLADGTHERCGRPTQKREQKQWLLRITTYAERLLKDLDLVDYPAKIRRQQENWIGKKEGITIRFPVLGSRLSDKSQSVISQPVKQTDEQTTDKLESENRKPKTDNDAIEAFTTRPDTMFGATFLVLAPEHPLVASLLTANLTNLPNKTNLTNFRTYVAQARAKTEQERIAAGRKKTGVFTGLYALNPLNGSEIPLWVSDFVLAHVGTGVVAGVPGHDKRDFEFAREFGLEVKRVVVSNLSDLGDSSNLDEPYEGEGFCVNSGFLDGLPTPEAKEKIMDFLEAKGLGQRTVSYHLRDWVFSRQHYWGEPIPVVYCAACATSDISKRPGLQKARPSKELMTTVENGVEYAIVPVPEDQLPVELPYVEKYEPSGTGESPLAKMTDWVKTRCPRCGGEARRETDTMPNWAGSNWYYLGYLVADKLGADRHCEESRQRRDDEATSVGSGDCFTSDSEVRNDGSNNIFSENKATINYWMPVDIYEGGFEHTTLHLLYSRFIYKFLYDLGVVPGPEPYAARRSHGVVLGPDGRKMSKSLGNVVNPEEIIKEYGADALRLYEMFVGPFAQAVSWNADSLAGCWRFLGRVFRLCRKKAGRESSPPMMQQYLHRTVKKVGEDLAALKFNTAVAALMEFVNVWENSRLSKAEVGIFLRLLAPFAPHLAEELWSRLRDPRISTDSGTDLHGSVAIGASADRCESVTWSVHQQPWPTYDERMLREEKVTIIVQVNGNLRERLRVNTGAGESEVRTLAEKSPRLAAYLRGPVKRTIFVQDKLLNFVI